MTNKEAITKLTNIMHDDHYSWPPAILTAFSMAVDALKGAETQPTQTNTPNALDCVSRQAAIDVMCELMHHWFGGDPKGEIREIKRELEKLPSAQPEQRWIPVSEKPIEKGLMLVTYNDGDVDLLKQPTAYRRSDIVAWTPLPEPWKEGEKK